MKEEPADNGDEDGLLLQEDQDLPAAGAPGRGRDEAVCRS